jgi:hypothetical protein
MASRRCARSYTGSAGSTAPDQVTDLHEPHIKAERSQERAFDLFRHGDRGHLRGPGACAVVSRAGCPADSLPFTEFLHETDAIADGNQNHLHPGIAGDRVIEGTDRSDMLVVREITDHLAALQHVV